MKNSSQALLMLLRRELQFLDGGGYRRSALFPWRARYIFEESPSCPNYADRTRQARCTDCWLIRFVPSELRTEQIPCRFVQLSPAGVSVDSLYRFGTSSETETTLRTWLQQRIQELEAELVKHPEMRPAA